MIENRNAYADFYENAIYAVRQGETEIRFSVGKHSDALNALLKKNNAATFAFITAYNPFSQTLSAEENKERQARLIADLHAQNYEFLTGYGTSADESWEREESLLIFNITKNSAVEIARKYEQNAILFGKITGKVQLVWVG